MEADFKASQASGAECSVAFKAALKDLQAEKASLSDLKVISSTGSYPESLMVHNQARLFGLQA
jgi:hypothetical protein